MSLLSQNVPMPRAWLLLFFSLLLAGCQPKLVSLGGQQSKPPMYVVSLSPSTTEIIATNGNNGQLRGRTAYCNYPSYVVTAPTVKIYGSVKPDFEKLTSDQPDLVVYEKGLYSDADIAKLKSGSYKTYEFHSTTIEGFVTQLKELGDILSSPLTMSEYVDKVNSERKLVMTRAPSVHPKMAVISGSLMSGTKTFVADVIRTAGGDPIGPDADRFVELNPESLIQGNPDIVLITVTLPADPAKHQAVGEAAVTKFMADPRFKGLKAVKSKAVFPVDADMLLRQGSRVDLLIDGIGQVVQSVAGQ